MSTHTDWLTWALIGLGIWALTAKRESPAALRARQLRMGTEVEMEHTNDPAIARRIAEDHLRELPDYYDRLAVMEAGF